MASKNFNPGSPMIINIHDLASALSGRRQFDVVLLDFSKAFDSVSHHQGLFTKLVHYGIRSKLLSWFKSLLTVSLKRL